MISNMFRNIQFFNLSCNSKKPAYFVVKLQNDPDNPSIITKSMGSYNKLVGFFDPETHLYVTSNKRGKRNVKSLGSGVEGKLRSAALRYAGERIREKLETLKAFRDQDEAKYNETYKDYDLIGNQLMEYLSDGYGFFASLTKQIHTIAPCDPVTANEYILYEDDDIFDVESEHLITSTVKLPYNHPQKDSLGVRQKRRVDKFLNVFFDKENKQIFSWFMGAVFLNKRIYDENIGKYLLISSSEGGVGKSTLMTILIEGLLGDEYASITSNFDQYFDDTNRFGANDIPRERLVVYSEANFQGKRSKLKNHDFDGLDDSQIKTLATEGLLHTEAKFQDAYLSRFNNMHIILTNFPPVISKARTDLSRRFISCLIRPTKMATTKAEKLGNETTDELIKYVHDDGQAFINYFAHEYLSDPYRFKNEDYNRNDVDKTLESLVNEMNTDESQTNTKLSKVDGLILIALLCDKHKIDYHDYIQHCVDVKNKQAQDTDIHWKTDDSQLMIYINSSKRAFMKYQGLLQIRDQLMELHNPIKKFGQNVIPLEITRSY